ncbi:hypothetical protein SH467x_001220 [Pirellulaceae bacterium SH467]
MKNSYWKLHRGTLHTRGRRGIAIIVAVAALTIVTGMIVPLVPPALRARRQCEVEEVALQAEMLRYAALQFGVLHWSAEAESVEKRGSIRLDENAATSGEWSVKVVRLDETERYRMEIAAIVHAAGANENAASSIDQVKSRYEIELDRSVLESLQERLVTEREQRGRTGSPSSIRIGINSINNN